MFLDWYAFGHQSEEMGEARGFDERAPRDHFEVLYNGPIEQCKGFVMVNEA